MQNITVLHRFFDISLTVVHLKPIHDNIRWAPCCSIFQELQHYLKDAPLNFRVKSATRLRIATITIFSTILDYSIFLELTDDEMR